MGDQPNIPLRAPPRCTRCIKYNLPGTGHNRSNRQCPGLIQEAAEAAPLPPNAHFGPLFPHIPADNPAQPAHADNIIEDIIQQMSQFNVGVNQRLPLLEMSFDDMNLLISKAKTVTHVPKRVLSTARRALTQYLKAIKDAHDQNDELQLLLLLKKLYLFQFVVSSAPSEPCPNGVSWSKHLCTILLARADKMLRDDWSDLYLDVFREKIIPVADGANRVRVRSGPRTRSMTEGERRLKRIEDLVAKGMLSKAYDRAVKDVKGAPTNDLTADKLRNLYPPRQREIAVEELRQTLDNIPVIEATPVQVKRAVNSMAKLVSPGVSGWRSEHLRQYIGEPTSPDGQQFLEAYTTFVNLAINYKLPNCFYRVMSDGEVIALLKKGDDCLGPVRPIGMGETLEKVCAILLKEKSKPDLPVVFGDHNQMAFTPFGAETSIHANQLHMELHPEHDGFGGDNANAFGNVSRDEIAHSLQECLPHLIPHFLANYLHTNKMWYRKDNGIDCILAPEGGVQGHTMMSLYFSMGARRTFAAMKECVPNGLSTFYVDDTTIRGPSGEVQSSILAMKDIGPTAGLHLNPLKSIVLIGRKESLEAARAAADQYVEILGGRPRIALHPDNYEDALEKAQAAKEYGMVHLGVPVGTPEYIQTWLAHRIDALHHEADKLKQLPGTQLKFALFYNCFKMKIDFLCRTVSPALIKPFLVQFESIKRSLLLDILRVPSLPDYAWALAQLDLSSGGLGLSNSMLIHEPAYLASQLAVEAFVRRSMRVTPDILEASTWCSTLTALKDKFPSHLDAIEQGFKGLQGRLCKKLYKILSDEVHSGIQDSEQFTPQDRATLLSMCDPSTSKWITVLPTRDLQMNNVEMQIALQARLLLPHPVIQPGSHCPHCANHPFIGAKGDQHVMGSCPSGSSRRILHDMMAKELAHLAVSGSFIAHLEPQGCFPVLLDPGRDIAKRPDIRILSDPRLPDPHRDILLDVTVTRPTSKSYLQARSATVAGVSLLKAESRKIDKFQQLAAANNHNFIPIAFEGPSGRMSDTAKKAVGTFIRAASEKKGINYSAMSNFWLRRLSVKFQIYNARIYLEKTAAIAASGNRRQGLALIDESELIYDNRIFVHGAERLVESGE
jgi:hypothetical protein